MQDLWLVSLICMVHGQRRYVIDNVFGYEDEIAVAIDVCMIMTDPVFPIPMGVKYTCAADKLSVTRTAYMDQLCGSPYPGNDTFTMNNKSSCGGDKFSCDGDDDYVMVQYSQYTCGSTLTGLIAMALGCYCDSPTTSFKYDCIDGSTGTKRTYSDTADCTGSDTTRSLSDCASLPLSIYAQMTECTLTTPKTSSPTSVPTTIRPTAGPTTSKPTVNPTTSIPSYSPITSDPTTTEPTKNPTTSLPTSSPSSHPTTAAPSNKPTALPSKNPSKSPTEDPTTSPSRKPTESTSNPTLSPSPYPTESPTIDPVIAKMMQHQEELDNLEALYQTTLIVFVSGFVFIALSAFIDAKYIRTNDYFKISQISGVVLQALDMFSDCFFSVNISIQNKMDSDYLIPLILSVIFIVIPATTTIIQLFLHSKKHWMYSSDQVRGWLQKRSKALYLVSVLTGNSFAAVSLFNSYIFQVNVFDMGLTEKELTGYSYKRVYSVVLLENVPQLCLQCWYLGSFAEFDDPITMSSIVFSLISIIVSVLSMLMQKNISQSQGHVVIKMQITGNTVTTNAKHCKTMKRKLQKKFALLVGVHRSVVEIIKPTPINQGFELKVNFYFGDFQKTRSFIKIDYEGVLRDAQKNGELKTIFEGGWNLKDPVIDIISCHEVQSKVERKRSEKRSKSVETQQAHNVQMTETHDNNEEATKRKFIDKVSTTVEDNHSND